MKIVDGHPGDRLRLSDGRVFELAFAMFPRPDGADVVIQPKKTRPSGYFAREIVDDFGGETRAEIEWLAGNLAVVEVVLDRSSIAGKEDGRRGDDVDPLLAHANKGML